MALSHVIGAADHPGNLLAAAAPPRCFPRDGVSAFPASEPSRAYLRVKWLRGQSGSSSGTAEEPRCRNRPRLLWGSRNGLTAIAFVSSRRPAVVRPAEP